MTLSIRDPETDDLVRKLAKLTGETMTEAIKRAVRERLEREQRERNEDRERLITELNAIALHCASLPETDSRSAEDILGYDENGLPT